MCISCNIDGQKVACESGTTILEAAKAANLNIPSLCYFKDLNQIGACRICVVEIEGNPRLMASCTTQVEDGMVIWTNSERVRASRARSIDLICKQHRMDCEYCPNYTFCELHAVVRQLGIDDRKYSQVYHERKADDSSPSFVRDNSKCIRCRRCVAACKGQGVEAVGPLHRAQATEIGSLLPTAETDCIGCGQCVRVCPTGALFVKDDTDRLWRAQNNRKKIVLGIMPATASNIGRFFGAKEDRDDMARLTDVCKKAGAFEVLDLTGLRELALNELEAEVARRWETTERPVSVSVCYGERHRKNREQEVLFSRDMDEIFREKTVELMEKRGVPREELFLVYVAPCTAAKKDCHCDAVLTTVELFQWIQRACVSKFTALSVWDAAREIVPTKLAADETLKIDEANIRLVSACSGGCGNGGGQFRVKGYQK